MDTSADLYLRYPLTGRALSGVCKEINGVPAVLGGSVVTFYWRTRGVVNGNWNSATATVTDAPNGKVQYTPLASDYGSGLFNPGDYDAYWQAVPIPNGSLTGVYPDGPFLLLRVTL